MQASHAFLAWTDARDPPIVASHFDPVRTMELPSEGPHDRRSRLLLPLAQAWEGAYHNAYLLLTITMMMWGGNAVISRMAIGEVSPMALVFLRWILSLIVLAFIARKRVILEWPILRERWRFVLIMGFVGYTV